MIGSRDDDRKMAVLKCEMLKCELKKKYKINAKEFNTVIKELK